MSNPNIVKVNRKRWCFVPGCANTSINNPDKVFISVPNNLQKKKRWFSAAGRELKDVSIKTHFYCCEDHFKLEEDMENYLEYKFSNVYIRMKPEVVPHIFTSQHNKKITDPLQSGGKCARKRKIIEILEETAMADQENTTDDPEPSTSSQATFSTNVSDRCIKNEYSEEKYQSGQIGDQCDATEGQNVSHEEAINALDVALKYVEQQLTESTVTDNLLVLSKWRDYAFDKLTHIQVKAEVKLEEDFNS